MYVLAVKGCINDYPRILFVSADIDKAVSLLSEITLNVSRCAQAAEDIRRITDQRDGCSPSDSLLYSLKFSLKDDMHSRLSELNMSHCPVHNYELFIFTVKDGDLRPIYRQLQDSKEGGSHQ